MVYHDCNPFAETLIFSWAEFNAPPFEKGGLGGFIGDGTRGKSTFLEHRT
jgi:hypothetical protein